MLHPRSEMMKACAAVGLLSLHGQQQGASRHLSGRHTMQEQGAEQTGLTAARAQSVSATVWLRMRLWC